jgi:hypothetical protein
MKIALFLLLCLSLLVLAFSFGGCQDPGRVVRQDRAYTALERMVMFELQQLVSGKMTLEEVATDLRKALDDLKATERSDQPEPLSIPQVGGVAGVVTAVGGIALNYFRNRTRKAELEDVPTFDDVAAKYEARIRELEDRTIKSA